MEAPGSTPGPGRAAAAAAEEHKPFHALAGGGLAAAEQDRPHTTGLGGSVVVGHASDQIENMVPVKDRIIKVTFNADVHASLQWNFRPQQTEIYVVPGETALAFYKAKNPTDKPVIGISTYNVVPFEAGQYFNKIQCFCFEEQRLNPQEEVDMPVFFYIDPEFAEDPRMVNVDLITLSYTFFEAKEGHKLPIPGYN
uniref:Cytochrome c oxidase assembly protein COX11, mitochondrial n=1 Tax=Rousettus aegyptiacus TaxID=9407 RepID=A0A7J8G7Q6_ROUAE|nr:cytochrome c oxidase copper chaperone COX11 [Rousettus aegyptiacus]